MNKCIECGESDTNEFYGKRKNLCKSCFNTMLYNKQLQTKQKVVDYLGGKCSRCSYNNYIGALEFHHKDPSIKETNIRMNRGWDRILKELDDCILVCANCHREIHYEMNRLP